ncbi:MAG: hypothetical protein KME32_00060 [Mojavia pulchra JT2-VF2]|jgi:hypothetical protein|uniref:Uncharacterized protein n=1 Tax=Mojavia pulchra JT2-VF2 TaxID=287848 RepID=A0A951UDP1_9NOST|nr:hypothetical protein [Mojavia pulchra JT2-VF2]
MATLYDLHIPDELYAQIEQLAKANNIPIEAQIIALLKAEVQKSIGLIRENSHN